MRLKKALKACQKKLDFTEGLLNMVQTYQNEPEPKLPRSSNPGQAACITGAFQTDLACHFVVSTFYARELHSASHGPWNHCIYM
jgi:hypothetical protein